MECLQLVHGAKQVKSLYSGVSALSLQNTVVPFSFQTVHTPHTPVCSQPAQLHCPTQKFIPNLTKKTTQIEYIWACNFLMCTPFLMLQNEALSSYGLRTNREKRAESFSFLHNILNLWNGRRKQGGT